MTLVNHLPEIGKENDYDALKKEMYRQHSIEVMLQQAFRQLDRYLSREHMDSLGEWRNELDEQLTNGKKQRRILKIAHRYFFLWVLSIFTEFFDIYKCDQILWGIC